eukprot:2981991-Amphidinium_carterae.1
MAPGSQLHLGWLCEAGSWRETAATAKYTSMYNCAMVWFAQALNVNIVAVRMSRAVPRLTRRPEYEFALACWWTHGHHDELSFHEFEDTEFDLQQHATNKHDVCIIQGLAQSDESDFVAGLGHEATTHNTPMDDEEQRLSTIPEEATDDDVSMADQMSLLATMFGLTTAAAWSRSEIQCIASEVQLDQQPLHVTDTVEPIRMPTCSQYHMKHECTADGAKLPQPDLCYLLDVVDSIDWTVHPSPVLQFDKEYQKLLPWETPDSVRQTDVDLQHGIDQAFCTFMWTAGEPACEHAFHEGIARSSRTNVDRDDLQLTTEDINNHWEDLSKEMLAELLRWQDEKDPTRKTRQIRARLTCRGFKDLQQEQENCAGTSSRSSQRIITSEAVCRGWKL